MSEHPRDERLDAWIDGRLSGADLAGLESHLAECADCARLAANLRAARRALRAAVGEPAPPEGLEARLSAVLDRFDREAASRSRELPSRGGWLPGWGLAAALLAVVSALALWWMVGPRPLDVVADAERQFTRLEARGLPPSLATSTVASVEQRWREARIDFPARVLDLEAMGIRLAGGGVARLGDAPAALTAYRGDLGLLLCWMRRAPATPLPAPAERRRHGPFEFHVYRRGAVTLVFWYEGEVLCGLAGQGDAEAVIALALAKAMAPPAATG